MPGSSTVYDVKVKYSVDDKASKGVTGIAAAADKASEGVFSLKHALEGLAIKELFHLGKEALIDFNSEIDQMKIGMTTVMQMNLHMPFEKANKEADKLFETFQALAKKSPLTTKDFMEMATAISPAIAMAGGGPAKLAKITQGALTAGLAYGQRSDIVAMDVQEMMMGNVTKRNRLGNELLGSIGMDHDEFNHKDAKSRAELVEKMFSQDGLQKAADRFGQTFKGQTSTLKDNLQITLGEVGRPLMEAMTAEVAKWNGFIEKHPKMIQEYVTKFAGMIKGAFEFVRSVTGWLVDNRELLFTIGKTFLVFKGAQLGTNIFKKFADGVGSLVEGTKNAGSTIAGLFNGSNGSGIGGAFKGLVGILSGAGGVIPALSIFTGALSIVSELLNDHAESDKKAKEAQMSLHEAVGDIPQLQSRRKELEGLLAQQNLPGVARDDQTEMRERYATELKGIQDKVFDPEHLGLILRKISDEQKSHGGFGFENSSLAQLQKERGLFMYDSRDPDKSKEIMGEVGTAMKLFNMQSIDARREILKYAFPEQWGSPNGSPKPAEPDAGWKGPSAAEVNVTIQKIEVASEDPDRFVFGLAKIAEQASKHPTQSTHATPGGF